MKEQLLGYIAHLLLKYLSLTWRYEYHFKSDEDKKFFWDAIEKPNHDPKKQFLIGFFHQDELSIIPLLAYKDISVLVSMSKDGQIMTHNALYFGYVPVRGSSSRGAVAGFMAAFKKVKKGYKLAMAVDGPRGPIYKVKDGIPSISTKANVPVVPMRLYPKSYKMFHKAWNKAKFPYPFSKIIVNVGEIKVYEREALETELLSMKEE